MSEADSALLERWCGWRSCLAGGPGFVPSGCPFHNQAAFGTDVPGCVQDLRDHFGRCAVTMDDLERCVLSMQANDACERLVRFGACTELVGQDAETAYIPCHYLLAVECEEVVTCMEEEWGVVFVAPEGY